LPADIPVDYPGWYDDCFELLMTLEGIESFDHAGRTMYGITQGFLDRKRNWKHYTVAEIDRPLAREIYFIEFWTLRNIDQINSKATAWKVFDMMVNSGESVGAKYIQRLVNANPDGLIGPKTIAAINKYIARFGGIQLAERMAQEQAARYRYLVVMDAVNGYPKNLARFLDGWLRRAFTMVK